MQCIVVKTDEFENSSPLIYFPFSWLCCCSLPTVAPQQLLLYIEWIWTNYGKWSRNLVEAIRTSTINCRVRFIDLFLVFPRNFRMVFLPHTNTVILLEPYCGTITEPGLPVGQLVSMCEFKVTMHWRCVDSCYVFTLVMELNHFSGVEVVMTGIRMKAVIANDLSNVSTQSAIISSSLCSRYELFIISKHFLGRFMFMLVCHLQNLMRP